MKNVAFVAMALFAMICGISAQAQPAPDYFVGKWNTTVYGTPNGDAKMVLDLKREEGKLSGTILASAEQGEALPISELEEKDNSITVYFTAAGYQVNMTLEKKDDDHVTGNMMGMFSADGERVK
jgi:hypothetical protein